MKLEAVGDDEDPLAELRPKLETLCVSRCPPSPLDKDLSRDPCQRGKNPSVLSQGPSAPRPAGPTESAASRRVHWVGTCVGRKTLRVKKEFGLHFPLDPPGHRFLYNYLINAQI